MKYSEWAPAAPDPKGQGLPDRQDWIVVVGRNRDSDALVRSNFRVALKEMGGEHTGVEVHRFSHWACGWCEILLVAPELAEDADKIRKALDAYPALDEQDYAMEMEDEDV